ncbi:MAG: SPOR domain-containing protein [Thermoanaerobaculia bacterium]
MDEGRTHYQMSFTPAQGLAVFLVLLGSLAGAYFFGLMTGLAGRDEPAASDTPAGAAVGAPAEEAFPTPVLGIQPGAPGRASAPPPSAAAAPGAAPSGTVQLFEDRGEGERGTSAPGGPGPAYGRGSTTVDGSRSPEPPGFWVQVVSLSSEGEARARTARLVQRGYPAVVVPGPASARGTVYRVRVGPFSRREEAARAAARLSAEEKTETWIVPSGR